MKLLSEIQKNLKAPKNQYNTFGKYNYRSCSDIVEAVKPLMGNAALTMSDEIVLIGERYYVKATVTFTHEGDRVTVTAYAREAESRKGMNADQLTGATSSYARKYALNGLFAIDDAKDSDDMNKHGKGNGIGADAKSKPQPKPQQDVTKIVEQTFFNYTTEHADEVAKGFAFDGVKFKTALQNQWKKLPKKQKDAFKNTQAEFSALSKKVKVEDCLVEAA
jgi:hypothetical protein